MVDKFINSVHQLFGSPEEVMVYRKDNFLDYCSMLFITFLLTYYFYGGSHIFTITVACICILQMLFFIIRHGAKFTIPIILKKPQELIYLVYYKITNFKSMYLLAIALLCVENIVIYYTPGWPHYSEQIRQWLLFAFYTHFIVITIFRTVILYKHIVDRDKVLEILRLSPWKKYLAKDKNIYRELIHAYITGIVTHIVTLIPWYFVITTVNYSLVFMVLTIPIGFFIVTTFYNYQLNFWFYRDHWIAHHSKFNFFYLHGPHHDAIPSGLIAVGDTGYLEGFLRHLFGFPEAFLTPVISVITYTVFIFNDMLTHQYIPGVFPYTYDVYSQHAVHHYLSLQPYAIASPYVNIDEVVDGYQFYNKKFIWYYNLVQNYEYDEYK